MGYVKILDRIDIGNYRILQIFSIIFLTPLNECQSAVKVEVEATPNPKKGNWGLKETFKFRNASGPL